MKREKFFSGIKCKLHFTLEEEKETNIIYVLKFPNDKYYVGQTCNKDGLIARIKHHCYDTTKVKKSNKWKINILLKYREMDVFILKKCDVAELDFYEVFYINILKNKLINLESGGHKNKTVNKIVRKQISKTLKKYNSLRNYIYEIEYYNIYGNLLKTFKNTKEAALYFNTTKKEIWRMCKHRIISFNGQLKFKEDNSKIITDLSEKVTISNGIYRIKKEKRKTVINGEKYEYDTIWEYDLSGELQKEHSIYDLSDKEINAIVNSIKNNLNYKGKQWSLIKNEKMTATLSRHTKLSKKKGRRVIQLDDDGNIINIFLSVKCAGEFIGIKQYENIRSVCNGKRNKCGNYKWIYLDEYVQNEDEKNNLLDKYLRNMTF